MEKHMFLGSNTPNGFYGCFKDMCKISKVIILKGGAGTGKSTLMKKVGSMAISLNKDVEYYHCSSDVDSLDGVYIPSLNWTILDGTSPHSLEPELAGINQYIINLLDKANYNELSSNQIEIIKLANCKKQHFTNAYNYLKSANCLQSILDDKINSSVCCSNFDSILSDIISFIPQTNTTQSRRLFASAITQKGYINYYNSCFLNTKNIVLFCEYDCIAFNLIKQLEDYLNLHKINHIKYISPFNIKTTEAIELDGLTVSVNKPNIEPHILYNFNLTAKLSENESNHNFVATLFDSAVSELNFARDTHLNIEKYFNAAMDFNDINLKTQNIINQIFG